MREQAAKNVLMNDGKGRRVPADQCEALLASGQAKHYISNTVYRALKLGIEVKNPKTRDEKGELRRRYREARKVKHKRQEKRDQTKEGQEAKTAQAEK